MICPIIKQVKEIKTGHVHRLINGWIVIDSHTKFLIYINMSKQEMNKR